MIDYQTFCRLRQLYDEKGLNVSQIAAELLRRTTEPGVVHFDWVCADDTYGRNGGFLDALEEAQQRYLLDVPATTTVWRVDPATQVPPLGLVTFRRHWRPPFIYSPADVEALMAAVPRLIPTPLRATTFQAMIGLLAATGMRIGEVIALDRADIDWAEGVLIVRNSKFGKSREVPVRHDVEGLVCPTGDVGAFTAAVTRLIREPQTRTRLAAAGVVRAAEFRWDAVLDRTVANFATL